MNKKKLNRIRKKWKSSDMYAGSFYAEMQRDGFVVIHRGDWKDVSNSLCDTIRFIEDSDEKQIDYILSLDKLVGEITYREDLEGCAIYAPKMPDEFSVYALGCSEDMQLMLANVVTHISQQYGISPFVMTFFMCKNIMSDLEQSIINQFKEDLACIH